MASSAYRNILVPFDNSRFAQKALSKAKALAQAFGSTLYIATVVDISSVTSPGLIRSTERKAFGQIRGAAKDAARKIINEIEEECLADRINARTEVLEGSTASELLKFIKKNHIDLVVIGSKGLSGVSKINALGSISRKISEMADCPVMIVH